MNFPATMNFAPRREAAILIVDDAPDTLGMLRKILVQQGYQTSSPPPASARSASRAACIPS